MMVEVSPRTLTVPAPQTPGDIPVPGSYGRITAWLAKRVEVALATVDLTLPQYRVLGILKEAPNAATGLADRLAVRPPSVTNIIDGLVARGLVERKHEDSDRRRIALRITDQGVRTIEEADRTVDAYMTSIASCLPSKEEAMALRSLELWGQALANFHRVKTEPT
jgi:DNA-binding MarR family transcriptional regulator